MTCAKTRYRDRIAALLALASTGSTRKPKDRRESRAYPCPKCRGWHLTSMPITTGTGSGSGDGEGT